jgi:diguanylate cyclase
MAAECALHLVVHHGGEEFAVRLRGIALAEAAHMLNAVRPTVAAKRFSNRETDSALGVITVSAGVTAIHADEAAETPFQRAAQLPSYSVLPRKMVAIGFAWG